VNDDAESFERFRRHCEQSAIFIVAMAQEERAQQREHKQLSALMRDKLGLTDAEATAWGDVAEQEVPF